MAFDKYNELGELFEILKKGDTSMKAAITAQAKAADYLESIYNNGMQEGFKIAQKANNTIKNDTNK